MSIEMKGLNVLKPPASVWMVSYLPGPPTSRGSTEPYCTKRKELEEKKSAVLAISTQCTLAERHTYLSNIHTPPYSTSPADVKGLALGKLHC